MGLDSLVLQAHALSLCGDGPFDIARVQRRSFRQVAAGLSEARLYDECELKRAYFSAAKALHEQNVPPEEISARLGLSLFCDCGPYPKTGGSNGYPLPKALTFLALSLQGRPLPEIGARMSLDRQGAYEYLEMHDLTPVWRAARNERLSGPAHRKAVMQQLAGVLRQRVIQLGYAQGWAYGMAEEYLQRRMTRARSLSREQLQQLFLAYDAARNEGRKLRFDELAEACGASPMSVHKIFKTMGLQSMYKTMPAYRRAKSAAR